MLVKRTLTPRWVFGVKFGDFPRKFRQKLKIAWYRFLFLRSMSDELIEDFQLSRLQHSWQGVCICKLCCSKSAYKFILYELFALNFAWVRIKFYFKNCNETNCARFPAGALVWFKFLLAYMLSMRSFCSGNVAALTVKMHFIFQTRGVLCPFFEPDEISLTT